MMTHDTRRNVGPLSSSSNDRRHVSSETSVQVGGKTLVGTLKLHQDFIQLISKSVIADCLFALEVFAGGLPMTRGESYDCCNCKSTPRHTITQYHLLTISSWHSLPLHISLIQTNTNRYPVKPPSTSEPSVTSPMENQPSSKPSPESKPSVSRTNLNVTSPSN